LVEVSGFQNVFGMPPFSNPPSTITSLLQGVALGEAVAVGEGVGGTVAVGEAVAVAVGEAVAVAVGEAVAVAVGEAVAVGLGVGVAGQGPVVVMINCHPDPMLPTSPLASSKT
jgi:hypothetical protein